MFELFFLLVLSVGNHTVRWRRMAGGSEISTMGNKEDVPSLEGVDDDNCSVIIKLGKKFDSDIGC
jgi:hypothetical protein